MDSLRHHVIRQIDATVGRHDEPAIYGGDPGDPGLCGGPGSMSWEIHGDLASLLVAGTGAIVMQLLHPSVMAGVADHSDYQRDSVRRSRNTLGYVLRTTFGNTAAATRVIEGVRRIHDRVRGTRADGVPYRALDPELIAWVHTCIPWAVMTAYERYARPLTPGERDRYLREQAVIGRMGGAEWVPETAAELADFVERMRPRMALTEPLSEFLDFVAGKTGPVAVGKGERVQRWISLRAAMAAMPSWARHLTGTAQPELVDHWLLAPADRITTRLIRYAYPELPCRRLAVERVTNQ
jgi:uncharacterized protein (DUF2236 family)